jgi:hypothetical protein
MLAVFNMSHQETKQAVIKVDLEALDLLPERPWQEFIRADSLDASPDYHRSYWDRRTLDELNYIELDAAWRRTPELNIDSGTVTIPGMIPRRGRFISIRRY